MMGIMEKSGKAAVTSWEAVAGPNSDPSPAPPGIASSSDRIIFIRHGEKERLESPVTLLRQKWSEVQVDLDVGMTGGAGPSDTKTLF